MALSDWIERLRNRGRSSGPSESAVAIAEPPAEMESRTVNLDNLIAQARREGKIEAAQEFARALTTQVLPPVPSPSVPSPYGAYAFDRPITFSTPQPPTRHPGSLVSIDTLRQLAGTYDILRSCINHLKREVRTVPFSVVPKDGKDDSEATTKRCAEATMLFDRKGPVGGIGREYRHFEGALLEDVMVVGAGAIFHQRSRGGQWLSAVDIDAATIRPFTDAYGWAPPDTGPYAHHVYEQWIYGVQVATFGRADLSYDGIWPVSYSPYFLSPVEWLINVVNSALRADNWNQTWLTDGSTPDEMVALPQEWDSQQVINWQAFWDAMLAGNSAGRHKTKFVPGGSQWVGKESRKDQDFQAFELWLLKRTCSIMGVQPASIGFAGDQYKVTQDESMQATTQFGAGDLLTYRKAQLDDILDRAGYGDLETINVTEREKSEKEQAETGEVLIRSGQRTPNEVRKQQGMQPVENGDVLLVPSTVTTLERTVNPPEPPPTLPGPGGPNPTNPTADDTDDENDEEDPAARRADLARWERKALSRLKAGKSAASGFESGAISAHWRAEIYAALETVTTPEDVKNVFREAIATIEGRRFEDV